MSTEQRLAALWRATVAARSLEGIDESDRAKACRAAELERKATGAGQYRARPIAACDRAAAQRAVERDDEHARPVLTADLIASRSNPPN